MVRPGTEPVTFSTTNERGQNINLVNFIFSSSNPKLLLLPSKCSTIPVLATDNEHAALLLITDYYLLIIDTYYWLTITVQTCLSISNDLLVILSSSRI